MFGKNKSLSKLDRPPKKYSVDIKFV